MINEGKKWYYLAVKSLPALLKVVTCQNNPEKSFTEKKTKHTPSGYSLFTNCSFDLTKNKLDFYKGEHCMERFCKDLREQAMKIIEYEKKEMVPLTDEENESYENQKVCSICKKDFSTNENEKNVFKLYYKVRDHCHYTGKFRGAAHSICYWRYKTPKKIPTVFHNGSTYDYHFINQLAKEFDGQLQCLGENTEKHITFLVPVSKELDNGKTITHKLTNFIDSFRFMSTSLSHFVDNLSEILQKRMPRMGGKNKNQISMQFYWA